MGKGRVKTAAEAAANWQTAMQGGTAAAKYKAGVQGYQGNPMAEAATPDAMQRYQDGVNNSVSSGRRQAALQSADPNSWRNNAMNAGAQNLARGVSKGLPKYTNKAQKLAGVWQQQRDAVNAMPKGGLGNAQARAARALEIMMSAFGKS